LYVFAGTFFDYFFEGTFVVPVPKDYCHVLKDSICNIG